ncbi:hypothetical protein ACHHYP_10038 [Achlya hypogyna]|uniref:Uncharacterized protein n=1 Tax=Achlya hypogyna TaxID=1202772 RepID=A0A1V9ZIH4_ACHHY|nr:hypothetical protein ACHHYP_10038 [Achlya hypogyna]
MSGRKRKSLTGMGGQTSISAFFSPRSSQDESGVAHFPSSTELTSSVIDLLTATPPAKCFKSHTPVGGDDVIDLEDDDDVCVVTPQRPRAENNQKPFTPSSTVKSRMNNSLVFDLNTSLKTNNPEVAHAALRSLVALGKEYPTAMTFSQCLETIEDGIPSYERTVAICASLTFVYDQASLCKVSLEYPDHWKILATLLETTATRRMDDQWERTILVLQFFVYMLRRDLLLCESRFAATNREWVQHSRLHALLHTGGKAPRGKGGRVANQGILVAIDLMFQLWRRVYDGDCPGDASDDGRETCVAVVRLLEMLLLVTDQLENCLQRLLSRLADLSRSTRQLFLQTLQAPTLKLFVGTSHLGRKTTSRITEPEWFHAVVEGCVMAAFQNATATAANDAHTKELQRFATVHTTLFANDDTGGSVSSLLRAVLD